MLKRFTLTAAFGMALAAAPLTGALAADDTVVAKVNGKDVTLSDLQAYMNAESSMGGQPRSLDNDILYRDTLEKVVDEELLVMAAEKAKVGDREDVKKEIEQVTQVIVARAYMVDQIKSRLTDERVQKRYDEMKADFKPEDLYKARHILVEEEEKAKQLISQIKAGMDFAEVAKKDSIDKATGVNGGALTFTPTNPPLVPEFRDAALKLKAGEMTSTPVKTQFGWHIIKVEEVGKTEFPPLDKVKNQIRQMMLPKVQDEMIADLRKGAEVEMFDKDGKPLPEKTGDDAATKQ